MKPELNELPELAKEKHSETKKFFVKLRKKPPKDLDRTMERLHNAEFQRTDCLECGNCCKTTGPLFLDKDVERISKHLKMKAVDFEKHYLQRDSEGDLVLQKVPCTFLAADNYCMIYDVRPKACRQFPHTNHGKFQNFTELTLKNVAICPAAFNIVEKMKETLASKFYQRRK